LVKYLPRKIVRVWCRGKVIVFELEDDMYITSQLGMEGKWSHTPLYHSGLILNLEDNEKWYYDDSRHMGNIFIYLDVKSLETIRFKDHGPDMLLTALVKTGRIDVSTLHPLETTVSIEDWRRAITNKRIGTKKLCDFLKLQKYISIHGNYSRCDCMYIAKIRPDRQLNQLSEYEIDSLYYISLDVLLESYLNNGLTIYTFSSPEGIKGTYQTKVYGRTHDINGYPVVKSKFSNSKSEQTVHWVPQVQF
jgi:formamidopyrimidine-DNA glycosylase